MKWRKVIAMPTEHGAGGCPPVHSWKHSEDALTAGLVDGFESSYTPYI